MSDSAYSPHLRTALALTGTGTAGAYHAGVLRALQEAGVKIDLVAGRGAGVAGALFAAVDGGSHLWEPRGVWRQSTVRAYGFRPLWRVAGWVSGLALLILLTPLALLAVAVLFYVAGLLITLAGFEAGGAFVTGWFREWLDLLFAPSALPTIVPRLVALVLIVMVGSLAVAGLVRGGRGHRRRTAGGGVWRLLGAPIDTRAIVARFTGSLWHLIRGAAQVAQPDAPEVGRRYAELLFENLGQPGFRELLLTVHDLDARRDLVFGLLVEPARSRFFASTGGRDTVPRAAETFDLGGVARDYVLDVLAGSLSLPVAGDAHLITFPVEGYWRGETHRICDRPGSLIRLILEIAGAGVEQVILVSDAPASSLPHGLVSGRADLRGRAGEYVRAAETAAMRDASVVAMNVFRGVFEIRPLHNPVGPFDFEGAYDEHSDRRHGVAELVDRGYQDAYRQFIDPIVGAGGDRLAAGSSRSAGRGLPGAVSRGAS